MFMAILALVLGIAWFWYLSDIHNRKVAIEKGLAVNFNLNELVKAINEGKLAFRPYKPRKKNPEALRGWVSEPKGVFEYIVDKRVDGSQVTALRAYSEPLEVSADDLERVRNAIMNTFL